jgi:hypothetical protein
VARIREYEEIIDLQDKAIIALKEANAALAYGGIASNDPNYAGSPIQMYSTGKL